MGYLHDKQGPGDYRYLLFKNRKGRLFVLDLAIYKKYKPNIVIAVDNIKNTHSLAHFYRTNQSYSWKNENSERVLFVDALGPFLYFNEDVPVKFQLPLWQYTQILFESLELSENNPLEGLEISDRDVSNLIHGNCISCHKVFGFGGEAHHINALTLVKEPGFALPLENYDKKVMQNFLFNQTEVAAQIGVNPNPVPKDVALKLLDYLY